MEAHALAAGIDNDVQYPFLCTLLSGGHSLLAFVVDVDKFFLLGDSVDDAPGEAFDKIARYMKLRNMPTFKNMSGGQAIEFAAGLCKNPTDKYKFPAMMTQYRDCQFSFSGIKNTAKRYLTAEEKALKLKVDEIIPDYPDFCANLQGAIARHICMRTQRAMEFCEGKGLINGEEMNTFVVSGGVACNDFIYNALAELCNQMNFQAFRPSKKLCTDNGTMIAWNGFVRFIHNKGIYSHHEIDDIDAIPSCQLGISLIDLVKEASIRCDWIKLPSLRYSF